MPTPGFGIDWDPYRSGSSSGESYPCTGGSTECPRARFVILLLMKALDFVKVRLNFLPYFFQFYLIFTLKFYCLIPILSENKSYELKKKYGYRRICSSAKFIL